MRSWVVIFAGALAASCTTPNPAFRKSPKGDARPPGDGVASGTDAEAAEAGRSHCGDGTCQPGETPQSCPADCGGSKPVCGNGKCEPGETVASCPADCAGGTCAQGQTQCDGKDRIQFCHQGSWKTETCEDICNNNGYDYSTGCETSADTQKDSCMCGRYRAFGDLCDAKLKCAPSLFCGSFGSNKQGFCTRMCQKANATCYGSPAGTTAKCVLQVKGGYACGFICQSALPCPAGMTCDPTIELCKPQ